MPATTGFLQESRLRGVLESPGAQLAILLTFALIYRFSTFGHPALHDDEEFYFLVGQLMNDGALPYVDVWDRKPFGLFALYAIFAAFSDSVLAYQIPAWLFAAATGWVISKIVSEMASPLGGLMAGLSYVSALPLILGWGGQSPVFYNLFVALAALLVVRSEQKIATGKPEHAIDLAMLLCGIALTFKQTAIAEGVFLGLFCCIRLLRSGLGLRKVLPIMARWAALGAMPTVAIACFYAVIGHWHEFWVAMISSNLTKDRLSTTAVTLLASGLYVSLFPIICVALIGMLLRTDGKNAERHRWFLVGWLLAAATGFAIIPNFYNHYALPLLVPLSVAGGRLFSRRDVGFWFFIVLTFTSAGRYPFWNLTETNAAKRSFAEMADSIAKHGRDGGLFVYDGPPALYSETGRRPITALSMPMHLSFADEENVSHLDTADEVRRVLATRPAAILITPKPWFQPQNYKTRYLVEDYVRRHCRLVKDQMTREFYSNRRILIYGDCVTPDRTD